MAARKAAKVAGQGKLIFNSAGGQTFAYTGNLLSHRT